MRKSSWAQRWSVSLEFSIEVDPDSLSCVLGGAETVTERDGEKNAKENGIELTETAVYERLTTGQAAHKRYLEDVASHLVKMMIGTVESPRLLLNALVKAVGEGRLAVWSLSPPEQEPLEKTPRAHIVPGNAASHAAGPINNVGGNNKPERYLQQSIDHSADRGDAEPTRTTITVSLNDAAPAKGLRADVADSSGVRPDYALEGAPGINKILVALLAPQNFESVTALINAQKSSVFNGSNRGHPVYEVKLDIAPGQSPGIWSLLTEPTSAGAPRGTVQPLIATNVPDVSVREYA
jgi:hypothetical protein